LDEFKNYYIPHLANMEKKAEKEKESNPKK
jgi:hypothetical protein